MFKMLGWAVGTGPYIYIYIYNIYILYIYYIYILYITTRKNFGRGAKVQSQDSNFRGYIDRTLRLTFCSLEPKTFVTFSWNFI